MKRKAYRADTRTTDTRTAENRTATYLMLSSDNAFMTKKYGNKTYHHSVVHFLNSLPACIRQINKLPAFTTAVKTLVWLLLDKPFFKSLLLFCSKYINFIDSIEQTIND